jgi:8-oxo-dGTP diphosphatase
VTSKFNASSQEDYGNTPLSVNMIQTKNNGRRFVDIIRLAERDITKFSPIAGSFAVIVCKGKFLLCYNVWRNQWEIPAGSREGNETPMECAMRELYEETGQKVQVMKFIGLLHSVNIQDSSNIYNPVYFSTVSKLQPFRENDETSKILLWDLQEEIGPIDEVDINILNFLGGVDFESNGIEK